MKNTKLAFFSAFILAATPAYAQPWKIEKKIDPLTDKKTVTAVLGELGMMLGCVDRGKLGRHVSIKTILLRDPQERFLELKSFPVLVRFNSDAPLKLTGVAYGKSQGLTFVEVAISDDEDVALNNALKKFDEGKIAIRFGEGENAEDMIFDYVRGTQQAISEFGSCDGK